MTSDQRISAFLRYPGGKTKTAIQNKILAHLPASFQEYREPFLGGGGLFFAIPPYAVRKRWINDINKGLVEVYEALATRHEEFIDLCRSIKPAQTDEILVSSRTNSKKDSKKYNARLKEVFDSLKYNETCDQALRYFFINRTVWAGRVNYNPDMESRMYFSNPQGWNIVKTNRLEKAAEWLKGTQITSMDYNDLLQATGEDAVIYMDPPYVVNTELQKMSQLYEFGFTRDDHVKLAKNIKKCKHKVCISYDDHPLVRELYTIGEGFRLHEAEWKYCGSSQKEKKSGQELIITNYDIDIEHSFLYRMNNVDIFQK